MKEVERNRQERELVSKRDKQRKRERETNGKGERQ